MNADDEDEREREAREAYLRPIAKGGQPRPVAALPCGCSTDIDPDHLPTCGEGWSGPILEETPR